MDFVTIKSDKWFACLGHFMAPESNVNFDRMPKAIVSFFRLFTGVFESTAVAKVNFD